MKLIMKEREREKRGKREQINGHGFLKFKVTSVFNRKLAQEREKDRV